jgi:hypothetical protein
MVDYSGTAATIKNILWDWVINPLFWLLIIVFILVAVFIALKIRKKRKLIFPAVEVTEFGFNFLKVGWFGKKSFLKNLWDYGDQVMKTPTGELIEQFSEEDFTIVNGKRGVIFFREPHNRNLLPVSKFGLDAKSREITLTIPPRDFINTALEIIDEADRETSDWRQKAIMAILIGGVLIFALVSVIIIVKFTDERLDKAAATVIQAGTVCTDNCRLICSEIASGFAKSSNAP